MTLHFAYGSNMSRALMRVHCPLARAMGPAVLDHHRFIITRDGYASVVPRHGEIVHGILWRITARDLAALDAYESVDRGLYRPSALPVRTGSRRVSARVYVARPRGQGRPRPGYLDLVLAAARDWDLPLEYVQMVARWAPSGLRGAQISEEVV